MTASTVSSPTLNRGWAVTEIAHPGLRDVAPDCAECFALTQSAVVTARMTGSRGATYARGEHSVTVSQTYVPEPPAEGALLGVAVLTISHDHGRDVSAHTSRDAALEHLGGYVQAEWSHEISDDVKKPRARDKAIRDYFNIVDEEYRIDVF